jgi:hypothetical protein
MAFIPAVYGYHGTSHLAAASILQSGFLSSHNAYDWLGDGIYFWQDAPQRAWDWAEARWGARAAVLGSLLAVDECIDLLDIPWQQPLVAAYHSLVALMQQQQLALPVQTSGAHRLDRAVLNHVVHLLGRQGVLIRVVRSAFQEGTPIYPGSLLYERSHVQITIRDPALIQRSWLESP